MRGLILLSLLLVGCPTKEEMNKITGGSKHNLYHVTCLNEVFDEEGKILRRIRGIASAATDTEEQFRKVVAYLADLEVDACIGRAYKKEYFGD